MRSNIAITNYYRNFNCKKYRTTSGCNGRTTSGCNGRTTSGCAVIPSLQTITEISTTKITELPLDAH